MFFFRGAEEIRVEGRFGLNYTILDLATTGIGSDDRIVELALLQFREDGRVTRSYETLLNPGRDIPNSSFHGINEAMVEEAPGFAEVVKLVQNYLASSDLVLAFNIRLDLRMLGYHFQDLGLEMPTIQELCLTNLFRQLAPKAPRRLKELCESHGVPLDDANRSLTKIEAVHLVLLQYLSSMPAANGSLAPVKDIEAPRFTRDDSKERARAVSPILDRLTSRLPRHNVDSSFDRYFELLDDVFADSVLEHREAVALFLRASELGMDQEDTQRAHQAYVEGLLEVAYQDGFYTEMEAEHLEAVAAALNVTDVVRSADNKKLALYPRDLKGKITCFAGAPRGTLEGRNIGEAKLVELASEAGLRLSSTVTPKLDFLVVTESKNALERVSLAKRMKVPLVTEQVFWNWLGIQVQ